MGLHNNSTGTDVYSWYYKPCKWNNNTPNPWSYGYKATKSHYHLQIDTIDPVPGMTVREGGRILCGAKRHQSLQPPTSLRSGMRLVPPLDPHKHSPTQDTVH